MGLENDKKITYEDEIELYDLWRNVVKRKRIIFWIFILSMVSAAIVSFVMPKVYRGEVGVRIQPKDLISPKELSEIMGKFDKEKIQLIFPLNFDSIKEAMITPIPGSLDKFKITVELTQTTYFQDVIRTFVQYLNNIPLIKKGIEDSREQLTKRLEEIDVVMAKSQEDGERFQRMMVKEKLNPIGFNPVQFNRMLSDLEVEKISLRQAIKNLTGFEIVTNPILFQKPVSPKPVLYLVITGITSLFAGLLIVLLLKYFEKIREKAG